MFRKVHQDQTAKIGRYQRDDHAYTNNRRTVGGNSRGGKRSKGNGSAFAKDNGRTAMVGSSIPGVSGEREPT